jgi:hypothetical protein
LTLTTVNNWFAGIKRQHPSPFIAAPSGTASTVGRLILTDAKQWSRVMTRTLTALIVAATVAIGMIASPTTADARRWGHHGFPVAPIIGGLAAGAILGAALAPPPPYYVYAYEPVYLGPRCYVRRERTWDGRVWQVRRVEECY